MCTAKIIAGAGVIMREVPPFPIRHKDGEITIAEGRQGLIVNVFTEPEWRRRGTGQASDEHDYYLVTRTKSRWSCPARLR